MIFHHFSLFLTVYFLLFPFIIFNDPEWESFDFSVVVRILEIFPQQASVADFDLGPMGQWGNLVGWICSFGFAPVYGGF